jgi:hypothetical protein
VALEGLWSLSSCYALGFGIGFGVGLGPSGIFGPLISGMGLGLVSGFPLGLLWELFELFWWLIAITSSIHLFVYFTLGSLTYWFQISCRAARLISL